MLSVLEVAYPLLAIGLLGLTGIAVAGLLVGRRLPDRAPGSGAVPRWRARRPDRSAVRRVSAPPLIFPGSIACPIWPW